MLENTIHTGIDGRRYLVIHGDIFDLVVQNARWLAHLGDKAYDFAIQMNRLFNFFRRASGSLLVAVAMGQAEGQECGELYRRIRAALAAEARRHGADGVICGHIHYAVIRDNYRHSLHELRRLGRELHRARRARGRPFRNHLLVETGVESRLPARA